MKIADKIFTGEDAKVQIEDSLLELGVIFEDSAFDSYDCSMELYDIPDDQRLSEDAQKVIFDAGFSTVYLNHKNKWETHYNFNSGEFKAKEGFRVSYPEKRGEGETGILVEKMIDSWPKKWFETGYAVVVEVS